jgi:hypothetical protein
MKKIECWLIGLFLLIIILGLSSIKYNSATVDEFTHVPVGLAQLRTGKFNMESMNPPLIRMWASLPLLFFKPTLNLQPGFENIDYVFYARQFMLDNAPYYHTLMMLSRIMIFLLIIPLSLIVWTWVNKEYGIETGVAALFLLLLNPNILAHATLATTDFGLTVLFFAAVYVLKRFITIPNWKHVILAGIILGLAQCTKFTGLLLYPIYILGFILMALKSNKLPKKKLIGIASIIFIISILIINCIYAFQLTGTPLRNFEFHSSLFRMVKSILPDSLPIPFPYFYVLGIDSQLAYAKGFDNYLNGTLSTTGWWYYYLYAFLIKNPVPFLVCLISGSYIYFKKTKFNQIDWLLIIPPILIMMLFSISTTKNIGLRFILPIYPFLAILAAQTIKIQVPKNKYLFGVLASWYLLSCLWFSPNYIAYFNELVGGPAKGYQYLLDSNLDWGQDLIRLRHYLKKNQINQITLAHFGPVDPAIYGINVIPLTSKPRTGLVAISVNNLCGISLVNKQEFAWLKQYQPIAKVGYSIFIYDIKTTE